MAYIPTTWVDKVTKLGPTNLNHLELGLQVAAAVADAALPVPAALAAGDFPVWNGAAWVKASALTTQRINAYGVTIPKTTVGTMASGPPASPQDKDIWVATDVDAAGCRWVFQYNAGSASAYKWEFIGGPPVRVATGSLTTANTAATALVAGGTFTLPRSGDYWGDAGMSIGNASGFAGSYLATQQFAVNGTLAGYQGQVAIRQAGDTQTVLTVAALSGKTSGDVVDQRCYQNGTAATTNYTQPWFKITPLRVS